MFNRLRTWLGFKILGEKPAMCDGCSGYFHQYGLCPCSGDTMLCSDCLGKLFADGPDKFLDPAKDDKQKQETLP